MSVLAGFFSAYPLRARLQPALLAMLPLLCLLILAPDAWTPLKTALVIAVVAGVSLFLAQIARDAGRRIEESLHRQWGGLPSVAMLRHRDHRIAPATKKRYHAQLTTALGTPMPSEADEASDPAAADRTYLSASDWLRARSRGAGFEALFEENIDYGFRRNLLGLKPWAIVSALVAGGVILLAHWRHWPMPVPAIAAPYVGPVIAFLVVFAVLMLLIVRKTWVKRAAENYALRLLETLDRVDAR
jgi:hypothetical protein